MVDEENIAQQVVATQAQDRFKPSDHTIVLLKGDCAMASEKPSGFLAAITAAAPPPRVTLIHETERDHYKEEDPPEQLVVAVWQKRAAEARRALEDSSKTWLLEIGSLVELAAKQMIYGSQDDIQLIADIMKLQLSDKLDKDRKYILDLALSPENINRAFTEALASLVAHETKSREDFKAWCRARIYSLLLELGATEKVNPVLFTKISQLVISSLDVEKCTAKLAAGFEAELSHTKQEHDPIRYFPAYQTSGIFKALPGDAQARFDKIIFEDARWPNAQRRLRDNICTKLKLLKLSGQQSTFRDLAERVACVTRFADAVKGRAHHYARARAQASLEGGGRDEATLPSPVIPHLTF